jgi:hypothetical protein
VRIDDSDETVAWSWERPDGGRSFGFSGLHFHENWRLIEYRRLVAQAILWTLRLPVPTKGLDVRVTDKELRLACVPRIGARRLLCLRRKGRTERQTSRRGAPASRSRYSLTVRLCRM